MLCEVPGDGEAIAADPTGGEAVPFPMIAGSIHSIVTAAGVCEVHTNRVGSNGKPTIVANTGLEGSLSPKQFTEMTRSMYDWPGSRPDTIISCALS